MKVIFDDYEARDGYNPWAFLCWDCLAKYKIPLRINLNNVEPGYTCSVEGCYNKADYIIDLPEDQVLETKDGKLEFYI